MQLKNEKKKLIEDIINIQKRNLIAKHSKKLNKINEDDLKLMEIIGKGAFGEVYKGILRQDENTEMNIAIKVIT